MKIIRSTPSETACRSRRPRFTRGQVTPLALTITLVALVVISSVIFIGKYWWFAKPASTLAPLIQYDIVLNLIVCGIIFVAAQLALAAIVFAYRDRGQKVRYFEGNNTFEVMWTVGAAVLFIGLAVFAERAWADLHFHGAGPNALPVEVMGEQFHWYMRYPGVDGKFGRMSVQFMDDSGGNPFGVDPKDPAGKDDIQSDILVVPVNREIDVTLRSKDVIHSFFVPELGFKQDAVPGMLIHVHFVATRTGRFEIACAELCGLGHHKMRSLLDVRSDADYQQWLKQQAAQ